MDEENHEADDTVTIIDMDTPHGETIDLTESLDGVVPKEDNHDEKQLAWEKKIQKTVKMLCENAPKSFRGGSAIFMHLRDALTSMDEELWRSKMSLETTEICFKCGSKNTQQWRRPERWGVTCQNCKCTVQYGFIGRRFPARRKKIRRKSPKDDLDEAIYREKIRQRRLREYNSNIRVMNEKISAWHAKARAIEQERLFKQAAAALPPDMSGKPSTGSTNPGSSQSSPHGLHKSLSRMIQ